MIFDKEAKIYNGERNLSSIDGAVLASILYVENEKKNIFVILCKAQAQVNQVPLHRTGFTYSNKSDIWKKL